MSTERATLRAEHLVKSYKNVNVVKGISLEVTQGEIVGLLGPNGAGKTTLMNCLYGFLEADEGEIFINGEKVNVTDPNVAIDHGIGMVHQHVGDDHLGHPRERRERRAGERQDREQHRVQRRRDGVRGEHARQPATGQESLIDLGVGRFGGDDGQEAHGDVAQRRADRQGGCDVRHGRGHDRHRRPTCRQRLLW